MPATEIIHNMVKLDKPLAAEYPRLLEIWEASVRATHDFLTEEDILFFKTFIQEHKAFEQVSLVGARGEDNHLVGFMGVAEDRLEMLFLDPRYRNKGIGKTLLLHAIDVLGVQKVDVNEQNTSAKAFYEKFGFRAVARSEKDGTGKPFPILHMELR